MQIEFTVLTPTYNANRWIRSCVASVADQEGVTVQHIVQDGLSRDGTAEYVTTEPRIEGESRKDAGMYDAINQAWAKCTGKYVLHLNADEGLLPGSLAMVAKYFQEHADVDVILTGTLICDANGSLLCYRKPLRPPLTILLTSHHPVQTCSIFLRRSAFKDRKWLYDPSFRVGSDVHLMIDIVRKRRKIALLDRFTSVFLLTGENLGLAQSSLAVSEYQYQLSLAPKWMQWLRPAIRAQFLLAKLLAGHYTSGPIVYDMYVPGKEHARSRFHVAKPTGIYRPYKSMALSQESHA